MGKDVSDLIGSALGHAARDLVKNASGSAKERSGKGIPGSAGVAAGAAAGAALIALAPKAKQGVEKAISGVQSAGEEKLKGAGDTVKDQVVDSIPGSGLFSKSGDDDEGGLSSNGGGEGRGGGGTTPGVGKGRRMPIQQDIDIGVPIETVNNQWTQFEDWPKFMHRVQQVSQEDETHVSFKTKIWGKTKEFKAEIVDQRPDERIKWKVAEGVTHSGVVTFHELGPRLTRVEVNLDVEPGSLLEKAARGMRYIKRAVRADLARFKAYVLMEEEATGEWRGEIEDGDVKSQSSSASSRSSSRSRSSSGDGSQSSARKSSGRKSSARKSSARKSSAKASKSAGSRSKSSGSPNKASSSRSKSSSSRKKSASSSNGNAASSSSSSSRRTRGAQNGNGRKAASSSSGSRTRRRTGSHS
jgi:uncharacterized membrane protein